MIDPELKSLIPPLLNDEFEQLEENILKYRKCLDPLIIWNGVMVDGHNRYEICKKHSIEFEIVEKDFDSKEDAMAWIIENQLGRRNLSDVTRIELALFKAEILRKKAQKNQSKGGKSRKHGAKLLSKKSLRKETMHVRKALAKEAGISEGTLHNYMQIKENGGPQLLEQVKSGELKIGAAHRLLEKEVLAELRRIDGMYNFIADSYPFENNEEANNEISKRLNGLCGKLNEILNEFANKEEKKYEPEN